jgi:hypothetical protein
VLLEALRHAIQKVTNDGHDLIHVDDGLFALYNKLLCGLHEVCVGRGGTRARVMIMSADVDDKKCAFLFLYGSLLSSLFS